ncbi:MAG: ROK family protein [Clostridia bacterium]|nr:ROK family protein [Clostridia bacterium]
MRNKLQNEKLSSKEILQILKDKTKSNELEDILKTYIEYLSIGIANFARICSSDVVVLGGSFVYFKDVLFDRLLEELDRIMIPMEKKNVKIKLAMLGNDAGIIGATRIKANS